MTGAGTFPVTRRHHFKGGILMEKATVYFTRTITPEQMIRMYQALGITLEGPVAVKVHSVEVG